MAFGDDRGVSCCSRCHVGRHKPTESGAFCFAAPWDSVAHVHSTINTQKAFFDHRSGAENDFDVEFLVHFVHDESCLQSCMENEKRTAHV